MTRRQNTQIRSRCKPPKKGRCSSHQEEVPAASCGSRCFTSQMYLSADADLVLVEPEGVEDDDKLKDWIERAVRFVETLPAKPRWLTKHRPAEEITSRSWPLPLVSVSC